MDVAWIVLAVGVAVAWVRGVRFRRGTDRSFVAWYRNVKRPAVWRHIPLIAPYSFGYVFALIVVGAIRVTFGPPHTRLALDILWASLAAVAFMLAFALSIWRMYSPPTWLIPSWLVDDDQRVGYMRPKPSWEDRVWLLISIGFATMAVVTAVYVGSIILSHADGQA